MKLPHCSADVQMILKYVLHIILFSAVFYQCLRIAGLKKQGKTFQPLSRLYAAKHVGKGS